MDVAARLKECRAGLSAASGPEPGRVWCSAWTAEVDRGLGELHDGVELPRGRLALVATGGYGRGELCPGSDIDLLLLYDGLGHDQLEAVVRQVVYPLWDAGLEVGHAVRDQRQAVSLALEDTDAGTALLDARVVAGDRELLRATRDTFVSRLRKRSGRYLSGLLDADAARRDRVGDAAEVLEPDLKRGAGTLRDLQSLRWAAAALLGEPRLDALVAAGYLAAPDRAEIVRAYERLLAVRVALHLVAERPVDVLRLDLQQQVAERLGYRDADGVRATAADQLLHDVFLAARNLDHVHRRAWTLLRRDALHGRRRRRPVAEQVGGFGVADGVLRLDDAPLDDPSLPTRLLEALAVSGAALDARDATELTRMTAARDAPLPWDDAARDRFLGVLWLGRPALWALAELDQVGLLAAAIPEWDALRARPQRNPFHRYSLDRHAWHAAAELAELVRREPWAAETLEQVDDRDALMLGTLLHDVGKAHGEPHSETGVEAARAITRRLGVGGATEEASGRLVRLHLLLPDVATRRDLAEPGLTSAVAEEVGDRGTLAALHLLTVADGRATSRAAWSSWKASLVKNLVDKVGAVFDETHPDELADSAVNTVREAQQLAPQLGVDPDAVRAHLTLLPQRYAASMSPRSVVRHTALGAAPLLPAEVRTRVTPGPELPAGPQASASGYDDPSEYDALDVVALDAPGLFAKVAGVLALHGGSVVGAHAFTRRDGVAVDTFTVKRPAEMGGSWWARVEGDLVEAVAGRLALRARVARKAAIAARHQRGGAPEIPTTVTVEPDATGRTSLVEVHTVDGVGVLFAIVSALAELELGIVAARVATIGPEVVDVFYVRDATGQPLDDDHADEVVLAVEAALTG